MESVVEEEEPTVIVDPALEALVVRTRLARGTLPPQSQSSGRLPLAMIQQYLRENAEEPGEG